jgi:lysozyme
MKPATMLMAGAAAAVAVYAWRAQSAAADMGTDSTDSTDPASDEPTMLEDLQASAEQAMNRILGYSAASLSVSPAGENLIKRFESCKLQRYRLDGENGFTIGWGRFFKDGGPECPAVISQAQADAWFAEDVEARAAKWVRAFVTVNVTQAQFDALASMAYNMSPTSFKKIAAAVNDGQDPEEVAMQFTRPGSKYERGLRNRRGQELALFRAEGVPTA